MGERKSIKIFLGILGIVVVVMIAIFGLEVYNSSKTEKLNKSDISVFASSNPDNENQLIVTVDVKKENVYVTLYSFDGGKTWQASNQYIATDNKNLDIKLKDMEGNIIGETEYKVDKIDHKGPTIIVKLPPQIELNSKINLLSYVEAKDDSGIKGEIIATPSNLDTSTIGVKQIVFKATDNLGNETTITTEVTIIDKKVASGGQSGNSSESSGNGNNTQESNKKTYYRYRTKTIKNYECDYYSCDYIDYNDTVPITVTFDKSSYCCSGDNCEKSNPVINKPCPIGNYCMTVMVHRYQTEGDVCYDSTYITTDRRTAKTVCDSGEININGYCHKIESEGVYPSGCTTSNCVEFPSTSPCSGNVSNPQINHPCLPNMMCPAVMVNQYQKKDNICYDSKYIMITQPEYEKTICDSDEISIGGYCHNIDSKGTYNCPTGYVKTDTNTCAKQKQKTCSKTCKSEIWSEWSEWSPAKVVPTDTVEVQTKTM